MKFNPLKYDKALHQRTLDAMIDGLNSTMPDFSTKNKVLNWHSCRVCGESLRPLKLCSMCKSVHYCSRECQKLDWRDGGHKDECKEIQEEGKG